MAKIDDKLAYLEDERRKLWAKVVAIEKKQFITENDLQNLEADVKKKTSDYEESAKQASKKASEFRNKCEDSKNLAYQYLEEAKTKGSEIDSVHSAIIDLHSTISEMHVNSVDKKTEIEVISSNINDQNAVIVKNILDLDSLFTNLPAYEEKIEKLNSVLSKSEDYLLKNDALYKSISARKKEVDELYYEIIGFTEKDDTSGEETKVPGLKDELDTVYESLKNNFASLQKEVGEYKARTIAEYKDFTAKKEADFSTKFSAWDAGYGKAIQNIEELLPKALTAGLSHAYSEKKLAEIEESKVLSVKFSIAITGMILVSLIPFVVSIYSWKQNFPFEKVLLDMPRLVLSILPLYIPVLWLAYSANKSLKLSKRLIEEYTHKEVLSKTFEGLSRQIENIKDKEISFDLRTKLLYNILEVNSENPGKLITDYNKSDHPLMDALDKSFKLANAVDKLADIPGLSKLAQVLDKKSKRLLKEKQEKTDEGLAVISKENKEKIDGEGEEED